MEFVEYVRKPIPCQVVQLTEENFEALTLKFNAVPLTATDGHYLSISNSRFQGTVEVHLGDWIVVWGDDVNFVKIYNDETFHKMFDPAS